MFIVTPRPSHRHRRGATPNRSRSPSVSRVSRSRSPARRKRDCPSPSRSICHASRRSTIGRLPAYRGDEMPRSPSPGTVRGRGQTRNTPPPRPSSSSKSLPSTTQSRARVQSSEPLAIVPYPTSKARAMSLDAGVRIARSALSRLADCRLCGLPITDATDRYRTLNFHRECCYFAAVIDCLLL